MEKSQGGSTEMDRIAATCTSQPEVRLQERANGAAPCDRLPLHPRRP